MATVNGDLMGWHNKTYIHPNCYAIKKMIHMLDDKSSTEAEYVLLDKVWESINYELEEMDINIDCLIA